MSYKTCNKKWPNISIILVHGLQEHTWQSYKWRISLVLCATFHSSKLEMDRNDEKLSRKYERSVKTPPPPWSLRMVLKHSDGLDIMLMTLGTIGCVADGSVHVFNHASSNNLMNGYASTYLTLQDINKVNFRTEVNVQVNHVCFSSSSLWPSTFFLKKASIVN